MADSPRPASPGGRLLEQIERPTIIRSFLVGLIVAQALYYAARDLASAGLIYDGGSLVNASFWRGIGGLIAEQGLQAIALFAGGLIAGAGHKQSLAAGAAIGVANSVSITAALQLLGRSPNELILYGQPVLHAFIGAAGGFVGGRFWQPAPDLSLLPRAARKGEEVLTTHLPEFDEVPDAEPLPWGRILLGILVAVGGTMWARMILKFVLSGSDSNEFLQSQFITWEITVVAQILGGGIAGSNTRNGFQYGFWVGVLSAATMILMLSATDLNLPTHAVLASLLGLSLPPGSAAAVIFQAGQALVLGVLGGWLGEMILPRFTKKRRLDRGLA